MLEVKIDTREVERALRKVGAKLLPVFERETDGTMDFVGRRLTDEIKLDYKRTIPKGKEFPVTNIGALEDSVDFRRKGKWIKKVLTIFSPLKYAIDVEEGIKPGRKVRMADLGFWVKRKFRGKIKRWQVYPIARSIQKKIYEKGTVGTYTFKRIFQKFKVWIIDEFRECLNRVILKIRP